VSLSSPHRGPLERRSFGEKDHATVVAAERRSAQLVENDPEVAQDVARAAMPARRAQTVAPSRLAPRALVPLAVAALLLAGVACTGGEKKAPAPGAAARRYTFRAEVVRLPEPGLKRPEITLRHERIPDFVNAEGKTVGMDAMVMPFEVGQGASLAGVDVGDKVAVRLAVDWSGPTFRLEEVKELPAETALDFGKGEGPGSAPR
jgi:Cu/Ag efflux protein CusF